MSPSTLGPSCFPPPSSSGVHGQDLWGAVTRRLLRTLPHPHAAPCHRASRCESWEGDIQITKFTSHPQLPGADRETEAQQAKLPKVTLCQPRVPGKLSPPDVGSLVCSARRASGGAARIQTKGRNCLGRPDRRSGDRQEGSPTRGAGQLIRRGPERRDRPMRSRERRRQALPFRGKGRSLRESGLVSASWKLELPDGGRGPGMSRVGARTFGLRRQGYCGEARPLVWGDRGTGGGDRTQDLWVVGMPGSLRDVW